MLGVGGGYYIDRDTKVKYETPSKTKLDALTCVNVWNSKTPNILKSFKSKEIWLEIQNFKQSYSSKNQLEFHKELSSIRKKINELNENEKIFLFGEAYQLRKLNEVIIDKIIIKFSNGDRYLFADNGKMMLGFNEKFGDEIYVKTQYLNRLFGLFDKQFTVVPETLPGGIKGGINAFNVNSFYEKIYLDFDNINSEWYEKITLRAPWTDKTLSYGDIIDMDLSITDKRNPYSLNDLFKFFEVKGSYSLKDGILEIYLSEMSPK